VIRVVVAIIPKLTVDKTIVPYYEKQNSDIDSVSFLYDNCPVVYCITKIGGKRKPIVLYLISKDINHFGKLYKRIQSMQQWG